MMPVFARNRDLVVCCKQSDDETNFASGMTLNRGAHHGTVTKFHLSVDNPVRFVAVTLYPRRISSRRTQYLTQRVLHDVEQDLRGQPSHRRNTGGPISRQARQRLAQVSNVCGGGGCSSGSGSDRPDKPMMQRTQPAS